MARVSVIIVNYNAGPRLLRCLAALKAQTFPPCEILLVDNASEDGSFEAACEAHPDVTPLAMDRNLGFAAANNRAAEMARGEWIALLNPDAYPEPRWLEELIAATRRHPQVKAFGSTQLMAEDPARIDGAGDNLHALGIPYRGHFGWPRATLPAEGPVLAACAAAALYDRAMFLGLGGFDERFFCYCEDIDYGLRLRLSGGETIQVPRAVVLHEGSGITGRMSGFSIYHGHRNRIWMVAKTFPSPLFWALLPFQMVVNLAFVLKFAPTAIGRDYRRAVIDGVRAIGALRRERVPARRAAAVGIGAALVWSPLALMRRRGKPVPRLEADRRKP